MPSPTWPSPTWATDHFTFSELSCKHCGKMEFSQDFLSHLEALRQEWDKPMVINSAYRCPDHPIEHAKGAPGEHSRGAIDVQLTGPDRYYLISLAIKLGWSGIGVGTGFLHLDRGLPRANAERPAVWIYKT